jgi:acyl transferase domain-containing protein/phosphopantetheinyl transferase
MQRIAIIGMACIYPGAPDLKSFWHNIVNGVDAISEVPPARWDPVFYDPESSAVDRFYCRRGGFVDAHAHFDPLRYGVMPNAVEAADPDQLLSLRIGIEALEDAGYADREFSRARTGVIIGRGNYIGAGAVRLQQQVRLIEQSLQMLRDLVPGIGEEELEKVRTQVRSKLEHYGPDVAVGLIPNLAASRLANRLDLHGPAYTLDAACASSLIAVEQACTALHSGDADMMLAGGLHFTHDLSFWATFCQLGALSRTQQVRPFSEDADGILAGEGIGMLVLKRVDDAERDGDRIYAVIEGVATASDGRSSSLLAPSLEGQLITLERAWKNIGFSRDATGLVEAHGTGTPTGDRTELETLKEFFGPEKDGEARAVLGSVKSMIGHTMPAAGAAGLIKAALSVYHGVLPPTLHCEKPHDSLQATRFRVLGKQEKWEQAAEKRVACVNAFGFGGINSHVVLSGHASAERKNSTATDTLPVTAFMAADSQAALLALLEKREWQTTPAKSSAGKSWRLCIIEPDERRIALAQKAVSAGQSWHGRQGIWFAAEGTLAEKGRVVFLFPGIDSRFEPRGDDVAAALGLPLSPYCVPNDPAQNLLPVSLGVSAFNTFMFRALSQLGLRADAMAGHSNGEWSAMTASGMLAQLPDVVFLAAATDIATVQAIVSEHHEFRDIVVSHDNCPHQVILCGSSASVEKFGARLSARQVLFQRLPFSSGFHTPFLEEQIGRYRDFFEAQELRQPDVPVWSATLAAPYPDTQAARRQLAVDHLLKPVRFRQMLLNLHEAGFRSFVQLGTGSLPGFVDDTLKGLPHLTVAANVEHRSGMEQLCHLLAALWVEGSDVDFSRLLPADAEPTKKTAEKPGRRVQLQLGVPLLRLEQPLAITAGAAAGIGGLPDTDPADNMHSFFANALQDIRQSEADILAAWQQYRQQRQGSVPVTHKEPAAFDVTVTRHLDINGNIPFVRDHTRFPQGRDWPVAADHNHIVPLTMEVSMICAAVEAQLPGHVATELRDVHAYNWLVVDEPVDVALRMTMARYPEVSVDLQGHMRATVTVAKQYPEAPQAAVPPLKASRPAAVDAATMYADDWMFHGPCYQGTVQLGPIGDNGIDGRLRVPSGDGGLLDNMGQLAGYWVMEQPEDCLAMPIGVERIRLFRSAPAEGEEFDCNIRVRQLDKTSCITDQTLSDSSGRVVALMEGWQARRFEMHHDFWISSKSWQKNLVCDVIAPGVVLFQDRFDTAVVRDYISKRVLNQPETAAYEKLSPRRRRQWLNGRVAVKDAVRALVWQTLGERPFYPKSILVQNRESGQPFVTPHIRRDFPESLQVSIAHKDLFAVAAAGDGPVGVDIERIEAREESFVRTAFTAEEIALLPVTDRDVWITRFWVAKEVIAKQMGTGLQGRPADFPVTAIEGEDISIVGRRVQTRRHGNHVIGWRTAT